MKILNEKLQVHDTLNSKIWDMETNLLLPLVKNKIMKVIDLFKEYTAIPIDIIDIQIVGSNASYNYTEYSDLDVHIIANYENISEDVNIVKLLYDANKSIFNNNFDIKIHGIEIELYVQDVKSGIISNGIYSVITDSWIKFPKPIAVQEFDTSVELNKWKNLISRILETGNSEEINKIINQIYLIRHNSIAVGGEYSKGNQLFKDIRNEGLLDALKDARNKALSNELSLESLSKGQIVNRFN